MEASPEKPEGSLAAVGLTSLHQMPAENQQSAKDKKTAGTAGQVCDGRSLALVALVGVVQQADQTKDEYGLA